MQRTHLVPYMYAVDANDCIGSLCVNITTDLLQYHALKLGSIVPFINQAEDTNFIGLKFRAGDSFRNGRQFKRYSVIHDLRSQNPYKTFLPACVKSSDL